MKISELQDILTNVYNDCGDIEISFGTKYGNNDYSSVNELGIEIELDKDNELLEITVLN